MSIPKQERTYKIVRAELVAFNPAGDPVLLGLFKGVTPVVGSLVQLVRTIRAADPPIPLGLLADPERLRFFRSDAGSPPRPVLTLGTVETLRHYRPGFGEGPIFADFMAALVEAWLRDLAIRWNRTPPPALDQVAAIGLLPQLEGGTVRRRVRIVCHRLH